MSLARKTEATCLPAESGPRAGVSKLYRTAATGGHAIVGKFFSQGASLVVAARPSASRSPTAARDVKGSSPSECQTRMGSGTLRLVKHKLTWQSIQRCRGRPVSACGSAQNARAMAPTPTPNPSIEGMPKRLRLSVTPHVKR